MGSKTGVVNPARHPPLHQAVIADQADARAIVQRNLEPIVGVTPLPAIRGVQVQDRHKGDIEHLDRPPFLHHE